MLILFRKPRNWFRNFPKDRRAADDNLYESLVLVRMKLRSNLIYHILREHRRGGEYHGHIISNSGVDVIIGFGIQFL
jgi:hypothetical protein